MQSVFASFSGPIVQLQSLVVVLKVKFDVRQEEQLVGLLHDEQFAGQDLQAPFSRTFAGRQAVQLLALVQLEQLAGH